MTHWLSRWWRDVSEVPPPWPPKVGPPPEDPGQLGEQAKRLLEDPVLQLALERMQAKLIESWRGTSLGQAEAREAAYRLLWASEQFKSELRVMVGSAAMVGRQE